VTGVWSIITFIDCSFIGYSVALSESDTQPPEASDVVLWTDTFRNPRRLHWM